MKLGLLGYGRMGREVERVAHARGHQVAVRLDIGDNEHGSGITAESFAGVDAAIDFSNAGAVLDNIDRATQIGIPMVIGTTGWGEQLDEVCRMVERRSAAVVYGANFSVGANLFFRLVEHAARLFDAFDEYDPYVLEHHHRDKIDAPSGTALRVAELVVNASRRKSKLQTGNPAGAIDPDALHVASLRAGGAFGEHRVGFDSSADAVQLVHSARGREGFAQGALLAAEWIYDKVGFFEFGVVLDEITGSADGSQ